MRQKSTFPSSWLREVFKDPAKRGRQWEWERKIKCVFLCVRRKRRRDEINIEGDRERKSKKARRIRDWGMVNAGRRKWRRLGIWLYPATLKRSFEIIVHREICGCLLYSGSAGVNWAMTPIFLFCSSSVYTQCLPLCLWACPPLLIHPFHSPPPPPLCSNPAFFSPLPLISHSLQATSVCSQTHRHTLTHTHMLLYLSSAYTPDCSPTP